MESSEILNETDKAVADAKLYGTGFLMLDAESRVRHIPAVDVLLRRPPPALAPIPIAAAPSRAQKIIQNAYARIGGVEHALPLPKGDLDMTLAVSDAAKQPDEPTLAQIMDRATDAQGDIWTALKLWRGRMIGDAGSIGQIDGLLYSALDAAHEAGLREANSADALSFIADELKRSQHIAELEAWKTSAMEVMAPLQDVAGELGLPLGKSITHELRDLVRSQAAEIARLRASLLDTSSNAAKPRRNKPAGSRW